MEHANDARVALLERLIDHAPLFPPASMELPEALEEDRRARESAFAFALGRFVCPASRLAQLPDVSRGVSAVLDVPLDPDASVEASETAASFDPSAGIPPAPEVYVEVPLDEGLEDRLDALREHGLRAKVRCGGAIVPSVDELARFVRLCRERGLVFKATAGLHHAVHGDREHGFLNLLGAAVFGDEDDVLREEEPDAFRLEKDAFGWRGRVARPDEIARARRERLHAIGSCSFFEPMEELEKLGVLPL